MVTTEVVRDGDGTAGSLRDSGKGRVDYDRLFGRSTVPPDGKELGLPSPGARSDATA